MRNKQGYIIMLTLLIISMAIVLITAVVRESLSYQRQVRAAQDKSNARLLTLSSLELAMSQLSFIPPQEKEEKQDQQKQSSGKPTEKLSSIQQWLLAILPLINRWHTVELAAILLWALQGKELQVITLLLNKARLILMFL